MVSGMKLRAALSVLLSVAVLAFYSMGSYALSSAAEQQQAGQDNGNGALTGVLSGSGLITVNGNPVRSGATIFSGSAIATGSDAVATIDLDSLGRVVLRPRSEVTLNLSAGLVEAKIPCDKVRITVTRGEVQVKSPEVATIRAGEEGRYGSATEAFTNGGTNFIIQCGDDPVVGVYTWPPLGGVIGMVALGAGVTTGVVTGGRRRPRQPSPSPVVPAP
jgi:hypothetical protein